MVIKIRYTTIDHYGESRKFKSLKGAQAYAQSRMGKHFDISENFGYVVSGDGVAKLIATGVDLYTLMGVARIPTENL